MSEVVTHKCPNCDGPLLFNPADQNFICEYCLSTFTEPEVLAFEKQQAPVAGPLAEARPKEKPAPSVSASATTTAEEAEMELFLCPSCGAEIVTELTTAATYCYYCHNPVVLQGRISGAFLPDKILPFKIEKEEAISRFLEWTRTKKFIPKDFFNQAQIEKLTGVYFPYWVVDAELEGTLQASATNVRVWRAGNYEYTQTSRYRIARGGALSFRDFIKNALSKNAKVKMVESVLPFALAEAVPFSSQYLAGFQAEKRDLELNDLQGEIKQELTNYSQELLQDTVSHYTSIYDKQGSVKLNKQESHYVLLPVWLLTYKNDQGTDEQEKLYYYAMNGRNGQISGKLPIERKRLSAYALGIGLLVLAIALIGGYFI